MPEWLMHRAEGRRRTVIGCSAATRAENSVTTPVRVVEDPDGDHLGYIRSPKWQVVPGEDEAPLMIRPRETFGEQWPVGYGHVERMGMGRIVALRIEDA